MPFANALRMEDMANMLQELEHDHLLLAGVIKGDEEAIHHAKHIIGEKVKDQRKPSHCCGAQGFGEPGDVCPGCECDTSSRKQKDTR